jgi:cobalt-zinc-cadmium efflux system protein
MAVHEHNRNNSDDKTGLKIALIITTLMAIIEALGGIYANSLALIGDAGHMLTDSIAIALSLFAMIIASKPPDIKRTYGHYRFEILASLINGATLVFVAGYIFYESYQRFLKPPEVKGAMMLSIASIGLIANLAGIYFISKGQQVNLNVRSAFLHMLGDTLSSVGVIVAGIIIYYTGWMLIDPIVSILIGGIILKGAVELVLESGNILLESVPRGISLVSVNDSMHSVDGVLNVHDLHLWSITSGINALSAHILIEDQRVSEGTRIINELNELLRDKFNINHTTLQLECSNCNEYPVCEIVIEKNTENS